MSYKLNNRILAGAFFILMASLTAGLGYLSLEQREQSPDANIASTTIEAAGSDFDFGRVPLSFEPNHGQTDERVKFLSRGQGYALFLTRDEAVLALQKADEKARASVLRIRLAGANQSPEMEAQDEQAGKSNYFVGNGPNHWRTDISTFASVRYKNVYPGIDQVFYGDGRQLEYDFVVGPNADARQVAVDFVGADKLEIGHDGELILTTGGEQIRQPKPVIYQEVEGERRFVAGEYRLLSEKRIGFELGDYDRSKTLTIDPVLVYSTFLGGNGADSGRAIAIDSARNVYVTGLTMSTNFPVTNPVQANLNGSNSDVFVTKINEAGNTKVYSTYIGGTIGDIGHGIDVDNAGNAYVAGTTGGSISTNDFPTVNAFDNTFGGTDDAFLLKLNPAGNALLYSTYIGGRDTDIAFEVKVNRATGEAFIAGNSLSQAGYPTTPGAYNTACSGCVSGAFVTKFNAAGNALVYSTFIGPGPANDLAIDAEDNAYVVGNTVDSFFPVTPGAAQTTCTGCNLGRSDAFITKLNPTGTALMYSTFLGGSIDEVGNSIAVDAAGQAYVTGRTESGSSATKPFPTTPGAYKAASSGTPDAYVTKLNSTGTAFIYSTYLGGNVLDEGLGIAVDPVGDAHITGKTRSTDFPLVSPLSSSLTPGSDHVFITTLNPTGSALLFSTFFGGGRGYEVVADNTGNIYVTGETFGNVPTMNPIQANPGGGNSVSDAFVSKIQVQQIQAVKTLFDFDGDRKADVSVFRPSNGTWYLLNSSSGLTTVPYGLSGDHIVPADYDGDGKTDVAIWRESEGNWYIIRSTTNAPTLQNWGGPGDRPVPADYDGDSRADTAVFRPSEGTWYIKKSSGGSSAQGWGDPNDAPVPADYDGDGRADIAVFRPSEGNWYIIKSTGGSMLVNWGIFGDTAVPGDYDADGKADQAVFRPSEGNWYIKKSSGGATIVNWGNFGDKPVAADYDGDGRTDIAIWRESEANFYIINSATNTVRVENLGSVGDRPVAAAYLR